MISETIERTNDITARMPNIDVDKYRRILRELDRFKDIHSRAKPDPDDTRPPDVAIAEHIRALDILRFIEDEIAHPLREHIMKIVRQKTASDDGDICAIRNNEPLDDTSIDRR
jgi:hypothetical protein